MSEDCHDSNNSNDADFRIFDDPAVLCAECGEPVFANEAYMVDIAHMDGTFEVVIFHEDFAKLCPLRWASKRLEASAAKWKIILDNMQQVLDELKSH